MTPGPPTPFTEAFAKFRARVPVATPLDTKDWLQMPLAIRERAHWSATIENARFMQRLQQALDDYLTGTTETIHTPDGRVVQQRKVGNKAEFIQIMRRFAESEGMGPLDPKHADTIKDITSSDRLGLIFDVQVTSAREYGRWKHGQSPEVLQEFPAYRFVRETDVTTPRKLHEEYEFAVRLKSDLPFWLRMNDPSIGGFGVPWGPWGFNSGMGVEEVDREEAESLDLLKPGDVVRPIQQEFNDYLEAGASGLEPEQLAWIKSKLGDLVRIDGDRIVFVEPRDRQSAPPAVERESPRVPAPLHPPSPSPQPSPGRAPVSAAVKTSTAKSNKRMANAMDDALIAIDSVHDDGILPDVPFHVGKLPQNAIAWFSSATDRYTGENFPVEIRIRPSAKQPRMALIHEIGHFIDFGAFGERRGGRAGYGSMLDDELAALMSAIRASNQFSAILAGDYPLGMKEYLLRPTELFARAYAQWIAGRSTNSKIHSEFLAVFNDKNAPPQWTEVDFGPIAEAMTALFRARGWLKEATQPAQ